MRDERSYNTGTCSPFSETRREDADFAPATRLEGQATNARGGMPRQFEMPAAVVQQGFTYSEPITSAARRHLCISCRMRLVIVLS